MTTATAHDFAAESPLDRAMIGLIRGYRSKLSSRKGGECAAGIAGHEACSTEILRLVRERGALGAAKPAFEQFGLCARSAWELTGGDTLARFQRNPNAGKVTGGKRGGSARGGAPKGAGAGRGGRGAPRGGGFFPMGGAGGTGRYPRASQRGFGSGGFGPMGRNYRSSGGRRSSVQGVFCCGPIPIPFKF